MRRSARVWQTLATLGTRAIILSIYSVHYHSIHEIEEETLEYTQKSENVK